MSKLFSKPNQSSINPKGRFEKFNLVENPFPSNPFVNKDSSDQRINGQIYEMAIRKQEYEHIEQHFLQRAQSDLNHYRLGYIVDESYIGRGNGKSAFLIQLQQIINNEYCIDVSKGMNKCFAIYLTPDTSGRTKTFSSFVDLFTYNLIKSGVIDDCLTILRVEAITELYPDLTIITEADDEDSVKQKLASMEWYKENSISLANVLEKIASNSYFQNFPEDFPLFEGRSSFFPKLITGTDFLNYYDSLIKRGRERNDFVFSYLVNLFVAAGFNGAYVLVDDFERIPDFQSARQKRDFALELRTCLFDGMYPSARYGFYNLILVLHAGVQRLISDAWAQSGMENRAPISPSVDSNHIIRFEKLNQVHTILLLKKYLSHYRITATADELLPFTTDAANLIGQVSEYNASKILKLAYELLDRASVLDVEKIDEDFVKENKSAEISSFEKPLPSIENVESLDLMKAATK